MLNYLSAELWRMTRRRAALFGWLVYFGMVVLAALLWSWESLEQSLTVLHDFLAVGLYLCFPLAAAANGEALRTGTLFNELSYGLPRGRVYLGKLLTALLAGLVLFLATVTVYLSLSMALTAGRPIDKDAFFLAWAELVRGVLLALPRYFGAMGLVHLLCFTLRTGSVAAICYYLYLTVGELTLSAVTLYGLGSIGDAVNFLAGMVRPYLLSGAFFDYGGAGIPPGVLTSWLTGLGWLVLTTALGMLLFQRREIR